MAAMSIEEQRALILKVAAEEGIDPQTALQVAQSEGWGQTEFAIGDQGKSKGPFQLLEGDDRTGPGLGDEFRQQFGVSPGPENVEQQIRFALKKAAHGGRGWGPWYGADRVGIGQYQGLPGQQPNQPGRRGRAGEVAQSPTPTFPYVQGQQSTKDDGLMSYFKKMYEEENKPGDKTIADAAVSAIGRLVGGPDRSKMKQSQKSKTLAQLAFGGPSDEEAEARDKAFEGFNEFAPMGTADQLAAIQKKKRPTVASMFMGQQPTQPAASGPTSLFGFLRSGLG